MSKYKEYCDYLNNELKMPLNGYKFNSQEFKCKKELLESIFGIQINCDDYSSVVNGEGKEDRKIDTAFSSSLQSLLVFSQVNRGKKIRFKLGGREIDFTKAYFEYKNKVIGYPSSIDVVLQSDKNELLFIESKLFEPVYESDTVGKSVVGISYFIKNRENSFYKKLKLKDKETLSYLGINCPEEYGTDIKPETKKYSIEAIEGNEYVYSEGIRQCLSHLIGVQNIDSPDEDCSRELANIKNKKCYFITIVNKLPSYNDNDKVNNFINHVDRVIETVKDNIKDSVCVCKTTTYQDLYSLNHDYFKDLKKVAEYYKLNKKD